MMPTTLPAFRAALLTAGAIVAMLVPFGAPPQAKVLEEIVAWVDGEIITKSDLEFEQRLLVEELYREFAGDELDAELEKARAQLLTSMIDKKILAHRAGRLFKLEELKEALIGEFMRSNQIEDLETLAVLLEREGLTIETLQQRLIEQQAPQELIRLEVTNRIAVSDADVQAFYDENPEEFMEPASYTIREIVLRAKADARDARRAEAEAIRARAAAPDADFEALVREHSESATKDDGGVVGPAGRGELLEAIERAAFSTPVGEVTPVLEMPYGFLVFRVEERNEERPIPFEDVQANVRAFLENRQYAEKLQTFLEKARSEAQCTVKEKYRDMLVDPDLCGSPEER